MSLKDGKIAAVKALIDSAPDAAIWSLEAALKADHSAGAIAVIRDMVNAEAVERRACAAVLAPLMRLCGPPSHPLSRLQFPAETPRRLWKALKQVGRAEVEQATAAWLGSAWSDSSPPVFDKLCARAARGIRSGETPFAVVATGMDAANADRLAKLLEMSALGRAALSKLPQWLARTSGAHVAAMRLAYKDADEAVERGGPLLIELLLAHLDEPWQILKLVGSILDSPNERYVGASELASVPERVMDEIERCIITVRDLDLVAGAAAGAEAGRAVQRGLACLTHIETGISLQKDGPWSNRVTHQRRSLATAVETRLHEVDPALNVALPTQNTRVAGRALRGMPKLNQAPDARLVARATTLLGFLNETRISAENGGFGTLRGKVQEAAEARLDQYAEDLLEQLHGQAAAPEHAAMIRQYLDAAAGLLAVLRGPKAGALLRRRAAA